MTPYTPPKPVSTDASQRTWLSIVFAMLAGVLSLLIAAGIISNWQILAQMAQPLTSLYALAGIAAMTAVMLTSSLGFAAVSYGLLVAQKLIWRYGLWAVAASLVGYLTCIAYGYMLFRSRST